MKIRMHLNECYPNNIPKFHDGRNLLEGIFTSSTANDMVQSRFYNGWNSCREMMGVLCFVAQGTIMSAFYNLPGCCHDSTVADL